MPGLPLSTGNYGRPRVGLPATRLVNAYIEATKGGPTKAARLPRPGLTYQYTLSPGPVLRQFQVPGLFNGDLFSISGGSFYRNSTFVGNVTYGNNPRMAAIQGQLMIVSGGSLYVYNGTTLNLVEFFDDGVSRLPPLSGVAVLYDIFVYPVSGSDQFFFSSVGDGSTINAANFSAAQTSPDPIVEVAVLAEELLFFGSNSVEFWDYQGSLTAPFALSQGRTYIRGCAAQGSVVKLDNAMFFVADDLSVYRSSAVPIKISTPYIDDVIRSCGANASQATAFYLGVEGHAFYVLNLPTVNQSFAYDCATQEWAEWGTQTGLQPDAGLYAAGCAAGQESSGIYLGSATTGDVWLLDVTNYTDAGTPMRVLVSGALWFEGGVQRCNNVSLQCVRGVGNSTVADPTVEMRFSDDGGRTWSSWLQSSLGYPGEYTFKATWRYLGLMQQPGRLFEFVVSDPAPFVVEGATWNEARP